MQIQPPSAFLLAERDQLEAFKNAHPELFIDQPDWEERKKLVDQASCKYRESKAVSRGEQYPPRHHKRVGGGHWDDFWDGL